MKNHIPIEADATADDIILSRPTRTLHSRRSVREPSARIYSQRRTRWLGLMGLGCIGVGALLIVWMGEAQRIKAYIDAGAGQQIWVFQDVPYPSSPELLGILMAGPGGLISLLSLAGAMWTGIAGLRGAKLKGATRLSRLLIMMLVLILPLLVIDFTIASGIEFSSQTLAASYFDHDPVALSVWSAVAISSVVVASLAIDLLVLRWVWRGSRRGEIIPKAL